jgi:hypothetical protein
MAGRDRASHEWAAIAHRRKPTALTAHNLACGERDSAARERLLREALDRDPYYTSSAAMLAKMIEGRSPTEARQLREGIVAALEPEMRSPDMDLNDLRRLRDAARATGQEALANRATVEIERREREVATHDAPFHERNLAQGRGDGRLLARER